uniref:Mediator of RNA polymerase II transcription subunit 14 n=1 Tax=Steinernema glaseri TaxID=37863 RepID=A0A1I8A6C2_9BILA
MDEFEDHGPPHIRLNVLLDFAVQQIYHDLTVLVELLPKKRDMDRKISIVKFAHDTRGLFVKILAAVKWLKTAGRFETCSSIMHFLDEQSSYFVETADRLVELARVELVHARIPCYQMAIASDTLTRTTYARLPLCIKKCFIPDAPITKKEQIQILHRLNHVIQNRLSQYSSKLSKRIKKIKVKNGTVTLEVPGEFEVTLTLLGERQDTDWTLLNIKMLVKDYEVGYGTTLVHPNQLNMLHNVLQARMLRSKQPITEVYNFLHHFAMNLQLDLLFCQTQMLLTGPMKAYVCIEKYSPNQGLLQIGYWMKRLSNNRWASQYRLVISFDADKPEKGLRIRHHPSCKGLEDPDIDDRTGHLSIEKVLSETMYIRCLERMLRLRTRLESIKPLRKVKFSGNHVPTLMWPLAAEGDDGGVDIPEDEYLSVGVNMFSGRVVCVVKALGPVPEIVKLEGLLTESAAADVVSRHISRLRVLLMMDRYQKAVSGLQVRIVKDVAMLPMLKELQQIPADRIYLQFLRDEHHFLVIAFTPNPESGIMVELYLYSTRNPNNRIQKIDIEKTADWYGVPHIPESGAVVVPKRSSCSTFVKEEIPADEDYERMDVDEDKPSTSYCWSNLHTRMGAVVSAIDDRLAFATVINELEKREVVMDKLSCEPVVGGLILRIRDLSKAISSVDNYSDFLDNISQITLRLDTRNKVYWPLECTLKNVIINADNLSVKGEFSPGPYSFIQELSGPGGNVASDTVASSLIQRFVSYAELYKTVAPFAKAYEAYYKNFCTVNGYYYNKIALAYGEQRDQLMILAYKAKTKTFSLTFGMASAPPTTGSRKPLRWNAHTMMASILNERFRQKKDLIWLVNYLIGTSAPLLALHNFSKMKLRSTKPLAQMMGIEQNFPVEMESHFIVASENIVLLMFGNIHIEINFLQVGKVGMRDCSPVKPLAYGLEAFWNRMKPDSKDVKGGFKPNSPMPNSPYQSQKPLSVPSHHLSQSPMMNMSLSVPPAHGFNDFFESSSPRGQTSPRSTFKKGPSLMASRAAFAVDHKTFEIGLSAEDRQKSPFAEYLFGLTAVSRFIAVINAFRQNNQRLGNFALDIIDMKIHNAAFKLCFNGANPTQNIKPWVVQSNVYMDQSIFKLKLRLDFNGSSVPNEESVRIAERYFEESVLPLQNEIAFFALLTVCRMASPGVFHDLTRIMSSQMDPDPTLPWKIGMQLVMEANAQVQGPQKKYVVGVVPNSSCSSFVFIICLRPTKKGTTLSQRYQLQFVYNLVNNVIEPRQPANDPTLTRLVKEGVERAQQSGECSIWPAIDNVMKNYTISTGSS